MLGFLFWFGIEDGVVFVGAWQTLNCSIFLAKFLKKELEVSGRRERKRERNSLNRVGFWGKYRRELKCTRGACVGGVKLKWPLVFTFSVFSRLSTRHRCA